jgi:hypothetical protein
VFRFHNLDPRHRPHGWRAVARWAIGDRLLGRRRVEPAGPGAPRVPPDLQAVCDTRGAPRLTWIGHASFLGSLGGGTFLVDPVFSPRAARLVRRHVPPGLAPHDRTTTTSMRLRFARCRRTWRSSCPARWGAGFTGAGSRG